MLKRILNIYSKIGQQDSCFLFGPRGVGKSALCNLFLEAKSPSLFVDLLEREQYRQHLDSPGLFQDMVQSHIQKDSILTVLVDEVQKLPVILDDVHAIIEKQFRSGSHSVRFILTGSSARRLKSSSANLLAGRVITLRLHPLITKEIAFDLHRALTIGLLPGFYLHHERAKEHLRAYADTYIHEEVLQEAFVRKAQSFEKFVDLAAQLNGEPVNFSRIGKAAGISGPTAESYFSILTDILIARRIESWTFSVKKQLALAPKYYFFDCGLLNALRGELSVPLKVSSYRYGKLFETLLINQILALNDYEAKDFKAYHWRTQSGKEVDLILARNPSDIPRAVEIKSEQSPQSAALSGLLSFKEDHPDALLYCLCQTTRRYNVGPIKVLPWRDGIDEILA